jgi:hypothetical protein
VSTLACLISVSTAPFACLGEKKYYDLLGTVKVLKRILSESIVDGFELQLQPEWDNEQPPLTDQEFADWKKTPKYNTQEVLGLVKSEKVPILSVHASRDVGNYLCSDSDRDLKKGKQVMCDALFLASELGASVCVFHLWDTRATSLNIQRIQDAFHEASAQFPSVKASVENIPTHLDGFTPFALAKEFEYVTLDLRWAAMYNELDAFQAIKHKLVNIHLRGRLEGESWVLDRSSFSFHDALKTITRDWGFKELLTLEREGKLDSSSFDDFVKAMRNLRSMIMNR